MSWNGPLRGWGGCWSSWEVKNPKNGEMIKSWCEENGRISRFLGALSTFEALSLRQHSSRKSPEVNSSSLEASQLQLSKFKIKALSHTQSESQPSFDQTNPFTALPTLERPASPKINFSKNFDIQARLPPPSQKGKKMTIKEVPRINQQKIGQKSRIKFYTNFLF